VYESCSGARHVGHGVEGLAGSVPLFSKMDCSLGRKGYEKQEMGKEGKKLLGYAHDMSATKLCTIIASTVLIRLKRICNFLCSMLVHTPFALRFITLRGVFMHFLELTY
jgi:hypothetical protein